MADIQPKEVFDILLESLKIQAEKYKTIVSQDALTHDQRKEFDSEIKQMYDLLSSMTNSTIILSSAEIETLKTDFEKKLQEFQLILDNPNLTLVKGETGSQGIQGEKGDKGDTGLQGIQGEKGDTGLQGIQGEKGDKGDTGSQGIQGEKGLDGQDGINGTNGLDGTMTFESLTPEQLALLKGEKGDAGLQGIQGEKGDKGDTGSQGIQGEKGDKGDTGLQGIQGLKGDTGLQGIQGEKGLDGANGIDGNSLTYNDLTEVQKQELANLVPVSGGGSSSSVSQVLGFRFSGADSKSYVHHKTNVKFDKDLLIEYSLIAPASAPQLTTGFVSLFLASGTNAYTVYKHDIVSSRNFGVYVSNDGFVCFYAESLVFQLLKLFFSFPLALPPVVTASMTTYGSSGFPLYSANSYVV